MSALAEQGWRAQRLGLLGAERGFTPALPPPDPAAPAPDPPDLAALPPEIRERIARQRAFAPEHRRFCAPGGPGALTLTVTPRPGAPADVQIGIDTHEWGPCMMEDDLDQGLAGRLPALLAPPGVALWPQGGGGSADEWTSRAQALTAQPAVDLAAHFAGQLEAAGWVRGAEGAAGPAAWSFWSVPGDPAGQGFLYVMEKPGTPRRDLLVEISAAANAGPSGTGGTTVVTAGRSHIRFGMIRTGRAEEAPGEAAPRAR